MYTAKLLEPTETAPYVEQFHIYGHGIANGVPEAEHLQRLLRETRGLVGLLIMKDAVPCALLTIVPEPVEDSHFPGTGIVCVHFAGKDLGLPGMRAVHDAVRRLAKSNDADWYSMSKRVSLYEYRNRYFMLREAT